MKKLLLVGLILIIIVMILYGLLSWLYWLSITNYQREFRWILNDYKIKLTTISEFILLNQIEKIKLTSNSQDEYSINAPKTLNNEDNKFIKESIVPVLKRFDYYSYDLWGVVGGYIQCYEIKRQTELVIFNCRNVLAKRDNIKLVYLKNNNPGIIRKYRLKTIDNNWYFFTGN